MKLKPGFRIGSSFKATFSPTGDRLVTIGKRITLWDVLARARIATGPPLAHTSELDWSPDGKLVVAKNTLGEVLILDGKTLAELGRFSGSGFGEGTEVRFALDGETFVDATWSGSLMVRDTRTGKVMWEESGEGLRSLTSTPDRLNWLYTRSTSTGYHVIVRRWPFKEHPGAVLSREEERMVWDVALSRDGRLAAVALSAGLSVYEDAGIRGWRLVAERRDLPTSGTHDTVAVSPDGSAIAYSGKQVATVFDRELNTIHETPMPYACAVEFAPAGDLLALGDWTSAGLVIAWPPA